MYRSNDDKFVECLSWSNQQTELFLAQQATFLEFDEGSALPPQELHRILSRIITINPDYPETVREMSTLLSVIVWRLNNRDFGYFFSIL